MELKRLFRSAVAVLLAASMLSSISAGAVAAAVTTPETTIEGERLEGEYAPEGNAVYFGANTVNLPEENGLYHVKLYREGDLSGTASVTIRSYDISARYGEDYELPGADTVTGTDTTLLEQSVQEQEEKAEPFSATATLLTDDPDGLADGTAEVEITDFQMNGGEDTAPAEKSGLAAEKEAETGTETRTVSDSVVINGSLADSIMGAVLPQYLLGMDYSAEQTVTFAPGEDEQEITFRVLNDCESEGTEGFSLIMVDSEGAEPYTNVAFSVIIEDDEPIVHSALSFSADSYKPEEGSVTVTVTRTGAEYSVATAVLTAYDDEGNVIERGEVAFAPYVTEMEVPLTLSGNSVLMLSDFTAAEAGEITEASVRASRSFFPVYGDENEIVSLMADGNQKSFTIKMAGNDYKVVYDKGAITGKVLDERYTPALEIGTYFLPNDKENGGMMSYKYTGTDPGWWGWWHHDFKTSDSSVWAQLEYYSGWTRDKGAAVAGMNLSDSRVDALYYRKLIPDWAQDRTAYGGQRSEFNVYFNKNSEGDAAGTISKSGSDREFSRQTDAGAGIEVKNRTGRITYRAAAIDNESNMTPKLRVYFYGVVALYKEYRVTTANPEEKQYLAGSGTISTVPVQFHVRSGAQVLSDTEARELYVSTDEDSSNIVFSLQSNTVNGVTDCFGTLKGYTITVTPENKDKKVVLNYPADFLNFISDKSRETVTGGADYSANGVAAEKEKITSHLDTIPMDKYFIQWIESAQQAVGSDKLGYTQSLNIRPEVDYCDVQVKFVTPEGNAANRGRFRNADYTAGKTQTFHAGDMLDLSGVSNDPSWRVVGFDVSVNGGVTFDTIRDKSTLVLLPNKDYIVRPAVAENANCIEVEFADAAAAANLSIVNRLIPQSELPAELKGKNILNLNPGAGTVYEKMRPEVGRAYNVDIVVTGTPDDSGKVYRPVIFDNLLLESFNGQRYYFNARCATADNRLTVRLEQVAASGIQKYSVDGIAMVSLPSVRNDSLGKHNTPAEGYMVIAPSGQGTMKVNGSNTACVLTADSGVDAAKGSFSLSDITGRPGDRISALIDNGCSDAQVAVITLGSDTSCNVGLLEVSYPYTAPRVVSLTYSYGNPENANKVDLRDNTVRAFDDTLNLSAVVESMGRDVEKAVFVITTSTGTTKSVYANPVSAGGNVYTAQIPDMLNSLHNGDRISVYLVDKETRTYATGKGEDTQYHSMPITYPVVETGLVIYVENEIIAPKEFFTENKIDLDIPLLGAAANDVKTGEMKFTRTNWQNNMGYTMTINVGVTNDGSEDNYKTKKENRATWLNNIEQVRQKQQVLRDAKQALASARPGMVAAAEADVAAAQTGVNDAKQVVNKKGTVTVEAKLCVAIDFLYNPRTKEYQVARFGITIGGSVEFSKTWYTVLSGFPCFLNLSGGAEVGLIFGRVINSAGDVLSQEEFNKYSGNIKDVLGGDGFQFQGDLILKGKVQVGMGMSGVLSGRGFASIALQFQAIYGNEANLNKDKDHLGFALNVAGGIGFDVLLGSVNFEIAKMKVGWGTLENVDEISFLGGFLQKDYAPKNTASLTAADGAAYTETVSVTPYSSGTADMSSFGQAASLASQPEEISRSVLLDNAADRTRSKLLRLPDGSDFLLFLGSAGRDEADDSCLYYIVRDVDCKWGEAQRVEDDGTYDSMPDAILYDGKVVLAWMDASKSFAGITDFREKYNAFDISTATYDPATGEMGEATSLVSNAYFAGYPSLCAARDYVDCVYMNRDISDMKSEEEMISYTGTYSTMARVDFKPSMEQIDDTQKKQEYIVIRNEELTDPLVTDYSRDSMIATDRTAPEKNGRTLFVSAYTVDMDNDLTGVTDRDLYVSFYDADKGVDYYPIRISDNAIGESNPQVTSLGDVGTYVTWVDENGVFCLLEVDELAEALFVNGAELGDPASPDWYHVASVPAGMDADNFAESIYAELNRDEFRIEQVALTDNGAVTVEEYQLATDGSDAYIFFVAPNPDYDSTGTDLYGMRYRCGCGSEAGGDDAAFGFTAPVAITHDDNVIDEFSLYVTDERKVELVSNYFTQSLNDASQIVYSPNQLVNISFVPAGSVEIVPGSLETEDYLVPGEESEATFTVRNSGLFPADSWVYALWYVGDSGNTVVDSVVCNLTLEPGQEYTVHANWTVPEGISGNRLAATVVERGTELIYQDREVLSLDGSAVADADIREVSIDEDGMLKMLTAVSNNGNARLAAYDEVVYDMQDPSNPVEIFREKEPSMRAGGVHSTLSSIELSPAYFDSFGCLNLRFAVEQNGETLAYTDTTLNSIVPLLAAFDTESVALEAGSTQAVTVSAAPWGEIAGDPLYLSGNHFVAEVDHETGVITAVSAGETVIYGVFPDVGLVTELPVTVTGETPAPSGGGGSHGNGSVKEDPTSGSNAYKDPTAATTPTTPETPVTPATPENPDAGNGTFTDVPASAYYAVPVDWAVEKGITNGTSETTFSPDMTCTRAQTVTFLWRAAGCPVVDDAENPFTDVSEDAYYYNAVLWAVANGITNGTSETTFSPDDTVTRGQTVTFLWRAAEQPEAAAENPFADVAESDYFCNAVLWAVEEGITNGTSETTFSPADGCTRGQIVTFLYRAQ